MKKRPHKEYFVERTHFMHSWFADLQKNAKIFRISIFKVLAISFN